MRRDRIAEGLERRPEGLLAAPQQLGTELRPPAADRLVGSGAGGAVLGGLFFRLIQLAEHSLHDLIAGIQADVVEQALDGLGGAGDEVLVADQVSSARTLLPASRQRVGGLAHLVDELRVAGRRGRARIPARRAWR